MQKPAHLPHLCRGHGLFHKRADVLHAPKRAQIAREGAGIFYQVIARRIIVMGGRALPQQNIHAPVEPEPLFVLTYYERSVEVHRPVYFSKTIDQANSQLGLNWILKVSNLEAPLNELQIQTHFRSIDNYSMRLENDSSNASLYFGRAMDFMLVQDYENALRVN